MQVTVDLALHYSSGTDTALIEIIMLYNNNNNPNDFYGGNMTQ